ncbi:SPOR domain-containing protein [Undibacterium jejuense]|uniref:SPOR domain-containing protein n=1 Tax=Undibacterium jejuense TaxID=1344949 RepID=A0A923KPN7_9BURK|nr:SPOR domain-containing protein [Undibacterium jejuense]MBC3862304.1 SPOR domain-containing protein [Undibacterium jejuense]
MGLLSRFKQKKETSDSHDSGEFRSRSEEDSIASRSRGKKSENTRKSKVDDPVLPEKKRARRRLIGAVALALAAIIGLPMLFDSEPKPLPDDIDIRIPSKDKMQLADATKPAEPAPPRKPNLVDVDPNEEIIDPISPATEKSSLKADQKTSVPEKKLSTQDVSVHKTDKADTVTLPKTEVKAVNKLTDSKNDAKPETKIEAKADAKLPSKLDVKADPKVEVKAEVKLENKADTTKSNKTAAGDDDAARAMAILEGKSPAKTAAKTTDVEHSSYVVQVAALATQEKVDELQSKLKAASIKSYTQKVATSSGDKIRIRVGPFESKEEADKMRAKLVKLGLNGSLVPN